jgi:hypothetical protein
MKEKTSEWIAIADLMAGVMAVVMLLLVLAVLQKSVSELRYQEELARAKVPKDDSVANLSELTDELTRLAPIKDIREAVMVVKDAGGSEKIRQAVDLVNKNGGLTEVESKIVRLARYEDGFGKPPCHFSLGADNKKIPRSVATVIATDDRISFQGNTPELREVLQKLDVSYDAVKTLSLKEFERTFTPIKQKQASCFYWLVFNEKTRFVEARDAARKSFQLFYRKAN